MRWRPRLAVPADGPNFQGAQLRKRSRSHRRVVERGRTGAARQAQALQAHAAASFPASAVRPRCPARLQMTIYATRLLRMIFSRAAISPPASPRVPAPSHHRHLPHLHLGPRGRRAPGPRLGIRRRLRPAGAAPGRGAPRRAWPPTVVRQPCLPSPASPVRLLRLLPHARLHQRGLVGVRPWLGWPPGRGHRGRQ